MNASHSHLCFSQVLIAPHSVLSRFNGFTDVLVRLNKRKPLETVEESSDATGRRAKAAARMRGTQRFSHSLGSGWVLLALIYFDVNNDPPATAGGTDFMALMREVVITKVRVIVRYSPQRT